MAPISNASTGMKRSKRQKKQRTVTDHSDDNCNEKMNNDIIIEYSLTSNISLNQNIDPSSTDKQKQSPCNDMQNVSSSTYQISPANDSSELCVKESVTEEDDDIDNAQKDSLRKESLVWKYATRNEYDQTASCKLCKKIIKTTNWSTTGLRKHINQVHSISLNASARRKETPNCSVSIKHELHSLIIKAIIIDSRSFDDFRRPGILKFIKRAVPGYLPPHRITVARRLNYLNSFYQRRLQKELSMLNKLSITLDFWSDRTLKSFLCITGHYCTDGFDFVSKILSFDVFYDRHQGVRIAKIVKEKLKHLNAFDKLKCVVTDGASNMVTMYENLEHNDSDWIWCTAHRLHLVIINALGFWSNKGKKADERNKSSNNNLNRSNYDHSNVNSSITNKSNNKNNSSNNDANCSNDSFRHNSNNNFDNLLFNVEDLEASEDEETIWDDATIDRSIHPEIIEEFDKREDNYLVDANDEKLNMEQNENEIEIEIEIENENENEDDYEDENDENFVDYAEINDNWRADVFGNDDELDNIDNKAIYCLIKKCRLFICITKRSTMLSNYFFRLRSQFEIKRGIRSDCITRWNSTFNMIDSFIVSKPLIMKFFGDKNQLDLRRALLKKLISIELQHDDWHLLSQLHAVLKPFALATKLISGRSYPTIGLCYYVIDKLRVFLANDEDDCAIIKSLKLMLLSKYDKYFYSNKDQLKLLKLYSFFDPIGFSVLTESDIQLAESEIKRLVREERKHFNQFSIASLSTSTNISSSTTTSQHNIETNSSMINAFLLACGETELINELKMKNEKLTINEELKLYKRNVGEFFNSHAPAANSSTIFWKKHYLRFPILAQLARTYLSAPGTSISSESAFSVSSHVARKERSRLSAEHLSYTMFLKDKVINQN